MRPAPLLHPHRAIPEPNGLLSAQAAPYTQRPSLGAHSPPPEGQPRASRPPLGTSSHLRPTTVAVLILSLDWGGKHYGFLSTRRVRTEPQSSRVGFDPLPSVSIPSSGLLHSFTSRRPGLRQLTQLCTAARWYSVMPEQSRAGADNGGQCKVLPPFVDLPFLVAYTCLYCYSYWYDASSGQTPTPRHLHERLVDTSSPPGPPAPVIVPQHLPITFPIRPLHSKPPMPHNRPSPSRSPRVFQTTAPSADSHRDCPGHPHPPLPQPHSPLMIAPSVPNPSLYLQAPSICPWCPSPRPHVRLGHLNPLSFDLPFPS